MKTGTFWARARKRSVFTGILAVVLAAVFPASMAYAAFTPTTDSFSTTASYLTGITQGPDGNMWYTSRSGGKIGKMTPSGTVLAEYQPASSDDTPHITTGADGNLWFTEFNGNKVGKITTSGTITEYTVPTASSYPYTITAGPDGNVWLLENDSGKIGKITPSGSITEYVIPSGSSDPQGITSGPDGNIWFTETSSHKIGKITTSGAITEYSLGSVAPAQITTGADGNLWFTTYTTKVGKITTDGTVTFYTTSALSSGIALGPDNLIWFTLVTGVNNIGSVSTSGTVTEYPLSGDPYVLNIAKGSDDNLYFAAYESSGRILKLSFPAKPGLPATKAVTVTSGEAAHIDVLTGISGSPDASTLTIVTPPAHGTAIVNTITYTPTAGYRGSDSLTYQVCSSVYSLICATGTLNFTVLAAAPNTGYVAPTASNNGALLVVVGILLLTSGYITRRYTLRKNN